MNTRDSVGVYLLWQLITCESRPHCFCTRKSVKYHSTELSRGAYLAFSKRSHEYEGLLFHLLQNRWGVLDTSLTK